LAGFRGPHRAHLSGFTPALVGDETRRRPPGGSASVMGRGGGDLRSLYLEADLLLGDVTGLSDRVSAVAARLVPDLADGCLIHASEDGTRLALVAAVHADAAAVPLLGRLGERAADLYPAELLAALATGERRLLPEAEAAFAGRAGAPEDREAVTGLRLGPVLFLPTAAERGVVGALTLVNTDRQFDTAQVETAGRIAARIGLALDYDRAQREAAAVTAAREQFLAVMSHELRTPLNIVRGYADLMIRGVPEPLPLTAMQHAERLQRAAAHLQGLIEEVLALARRGAADDRLHTGPVDLAAEVRDTLALVEGLSPERSLRFEAPAGEDPLWLRTDAAKLRRILLEVVSNAAKFTLAGEIVASVEAAGGMARVTIRDTGTGMAPKDAARAFDPFWKADASAGGLSPGPGLGLAVARTLAVLLGGRLTLASTPGEGTLVTLELPLDTDDKRTS
jgi:signal transduction histidine kinase